VACYWCEERNDTREQVKQTLSGNPQCGANVVGVALNGGGSPHHWFITTTLRMACLVAFRGGRFPEGGFSGYSYSIEVSCGSRERRLVLQIAEAGLSIAYGLRCWRLAAPHRLFSSSLSNHSWLGVLYSYRLGCARLLPPSIFRCLLTLSGRLGTAANLPIPAFPGLRVESLPHALAGHTGLTFSVARIRQFPTFFC